MKLLMISLFMKMNQWSIKLANTTKSGWLKIANKVVKVADQNSVAFFSSFPLKKQVDWLYK